MCLPVSFAAHLVNARTVLNVVVSWPNASPPPYGWTGAAVQRDVDKIAAQRDARRATAMSVSCGYLHCVYDKRLTF
jgi:hypothetical protein